MSNNKLKNYLFPFMFLSTFLFSLPAYGEEKTNYYYSETRAPIFYGAKEVYLRTGEKFDIKDSKYRVFANDFEDGDVTNKIQVQSTNVNMNVAGTYKVVYKVQDSNNNEQTFETKVVVSDTDDSRVIRKVYNNFSTWNTTLQGVARADHQDRQMLGIEIPAGKKAEVKVIKGPSLKVSVVTNDSHTDGTTVMINSNSHTSLSSKSGKSVPFVYTPLNTKEEADQEKDILLEVKLKDVDSVPYYHQGDNEQQFFSKWNDSVDQYGVIQGDALTVLVPYMDRNKLVNHWKKSFKTLDDFLTYYKKVRDRCDEMIGLEQKPENILDQVVKTRFFVRANAHGAGAAYYGTDHIGVNNPSVASFFEPNWGGLHEVGHGYQGGLSQGSMNLGEVSNNFFGYAIQHDKDIYAWNDYYLDITRDEQKYNNQRLNEKKKFKDIDVSGQFYILENLLQSFEFKDTILADMYKWYRRQKLEGNNPPNEEAWVRTFANNGINIIPYFDSWGINISDVLREEIFNMKNLKNVSILGDVVTDPVKLEEIKKIKQKDKYSGILTDELAEFGLTGSLTIKIEDETFKLLNGKTIQLTDKNNNIKNIQITDKEMTLTDIPIGIYNIFVPYVGENYFIEPQWTTIYQNKNTEVNIVYEKRSDFEYNGDQFFIRGIYNTDGIRGVLNKKLTKLTITLGAANLGNQSWPEGQLYSSVSIIDGTTNEIKKSYEVTGNGYYSYLEPNNLKQEISIKIGDKVKIYHEKPENVNIVSGITNKIDPFNSTTQKDTEYILTSTGFKKVSINEESYNENLYALKKERAINDLREAMKKLTNEEIENKLVLMNYKNNLIQLYNSLREEDRSEFTDFINRIKKGGSPKITILNDNIVIKPAKSIDLYSLITATDPEDGPIEINSNSTEIETEFNASQVGDYKVKYIVKDSDNNKTEAELTIRVSNDIEQDGSEEENQETDFSKASTNVNVTLLDNIRTNPNPVGPNGKPYTDPLNDNEKIELNSNFGLVYMPKAFDFGSKVLSDELSLQMQATKNTSFDIGIKDKDKIKKKWELGASLSTVLRDTTESVPGFYISTTSSSDIKLNENDGVNNFNNNDLKVNTDSSVVSKNNFKITSSENILVNTTENKQRYSVYNVNLGDVFFNHDSPQELPAGNYSGNINWNLRMVP
ncbi:hypothetical protein IGI95_002675 [Enterococcus sp. DIV0784]|uniref:immunoglobulin-like domain-containing protein n=1 Tax=unclassified Enterococcus TaxID=2608891 RepID=UPI003F290E71